MSPKYYILIFALLLGCTTINAEQTPNPEISGDNYVKLNRKIQCSLQDDKEVVFRWSGKAYSRVPGERDKNVFNVEGMNIRKCVSVNDEILGSGYRLISREIMLYLDPESNQILRTWDNPWSGESVEVVHVANDPVNSRPTFGRDKDGKVQELPIKVIDDQWFMAIEVPLFYANPLAGDYQKYVGGTYHATEIFDFMGSYKELIDGSNDQVSANIAWVRIAQWLPWMEMGSRAGLLYFNAVGKNISDYDDLPAVLENELASKYPTYTSAPPSDDDRKNETSWTVMKKLLDSREKDAE